LLIIIKHSFKNSLMEKSIKKEWLILVNPNAGVGKGIKDWKSISSLLSENKFEYEAVFTEKKLHAIELVQEKIAEGFRKIIVVGGDGTMNEAVNGIFNQDVVPTTEITLGMISVGTGNDWVKTFNIPLDYSEAIKIIKEEQTLLQDAGIVKFYNEAIQKIRYFVNMAGLGFDAMVASKTNADKESGKSNPLLYLKNLVTTLFSYKSSNTRVKVDNHVVNDKIFSIGIGIGQYNGGGMQQTPNAIPDDGLLDVTLIKHMSKLRIIASIRRLYNGTIGQHNRVETFVGKNIYVESKIPILLEADGESLGHSPFEFSIVPRSVKVIVNRKA
jgi:YegS/Rv2252/BmrU family lipid kinase